MSFPHPDPIIVDPPATPTNALAPVSRLPPELLIQIFDYCRECSEEEPYDWIPRATHVCSAWRAIALSAASLWSNLWPYPNTHSPLLAKEMLRRSGTSPLDIRIENHSVGEALEEALALNSYRISHLSIITDPELFQQYIKFCTRPAPALTYLELNDLAGEGQRLPVDSIFASDLPSLVSLSLTLCGINSLRPFCSTNLQHISISGLQVPVDHLHDALSSIPQLQTLEINNSLREARTAHYIPSPVHLPALRQLSVTNAAPLLLAFLSPLVCTFVDLDADDALTIQPICQDGSAATQQHLAALVAWACKSLAAPLTGVFINPWMYSLHCFPGGRLPRAALSEWQFSSPVNFNLHFDLHGNEDLMGVLFAAYLRALPWTSIVLLGIFEGDDMRRLPGRGWSDIFRRAKCVETLSMCQRSTSAQRELGALLEQDAYGSLVLPRLREVVVDDMCNDEAGVVGLWKILRERLPVSGTSSLSLIRTYGEAPHQDVPFPDTLREIMKAEPQIRVQWQGNVIDFNEPS